MLFCGSLRPQIFLGLPLIMLMTFQIIVFTNLLNLFSFIFHSILVSSVVVAFFLFYKERPPIPVDWDILMVLLRISVLTFVVIVVRYNLELTSKRMMARLLNFFSLLTFSLSYIVMGRRAPALKKLYPFELRVGSIGPRGGLGLFVILKSSLILKYENIIRKERTKERKGIQISKILSADFLKLSWAWRFIEIYSERNLNTA